MIKLKDQKRPYADPTAKRRSVYLSQAVWESLQRMGNGSASAGIRKAVAEYNKTGDNHGN